MRRIRFPIAFALLTLATAGSATDTVGSALNAPLLTVADTINPGSADYVVSGIHAAEAAGAPFLVIQLDTPGGLLSTTRQIVQAMLNAKIPIVVFISPRGAQAGSAGALITFAADVAAMAPGTNIGAAHPVSPGAEKTADKMEQKVANDTAAFAESLAAAKGRNKEWASNAVLKSASIPSDEAVRLNVVDFVVEDLVALSEKLRGHKLRVAKHGIRALPDEAPALRSVDPGIKHRVISFFANPSIAYVIMSFGGLCLWIELSHPGLILPGVMGVLCVLLSLVSFQMLPIDYGALALILAGMAMLVAELFVPSFGALGLGGLVAFVVGSLYLMDTQVPEFRISLTLILPTAAALAAFSLALGWLVLKSRRERVRSGNATLIGEFGEVREALSGSEGQVFVQGELWGAVSIDGAPIARGIVVEVREVRGLRLIVAPRSGEGPVERKS